MSRAMARIDLGALRCLDCPDFLHICRRQGIGEGLFDFPGRAPVVLLGIKSLLGRRKDAGNGRGTGPARRFTRMRVHGERKVAMNVVDLDPEGCNCPSIGARYPDKKCGTEDIDSH